MSGALDDPQAYVWMPHLDAGSPEPAPAEGTDVRAIHFRRSIAEDDVVRAVLVGTDGGCAPLARRIRHHGDADEGWDWGWRGSAPLETALNVLAVFVHPRAAWRLQWAFYEAFMHPLPVPGGTVDAEEIRAWLASHAWVGRQGAWLTAPEARHRAILARTRAESATSTPEARADLCGRLVTAALRRPGGDPQGVAVRESADPHEGMEEPGSGRFQLASAVATLAGAPAEQRWATLHALAHALPPPGGLLRDEWAGEAVPVTPGLPSPAMIETVARVHALTAGLDRTQRAALAAAVIRTEAADVGRWTSIPLLALPLGAYFEAAYRGDAYLAGDPVAAAATLHALQKHLQRDPGLASCAARLGLTPAVMAGRLEAASELHRWTLKEAVHEAEHAAACVLERVQAAHAARLPRGRSPTPPPTSPALRRWVLGIEEHVLLHLARAARGPAGPLTLRAALAAAGLHFPDPPGTVAQAIAWFLEERAPKLLDLPSFPGRCDGLFRTSPARRTESTTNPA